MDFISPFLTLPSFLQFFMLLLHILSIFRGFHIFPAPSQHINFLPKAVQGPLSLGTREHGDWTTFAHLASKRAFKERPRSVGKGYSYGNFMGLY